MYTAAIKTVFGRVSVERHCDIWRRNQTIINRRRRNDMIGSYLAQDLAAVGQLLLGAAR